MNNNLRRLVLHSYKALHRTRLQVFEGDERALEAGRRKIYEEYNKNRHVSDEEAIKTLVQVAEEAEKILRTQVIQAREQKPGVYRARITEHTLRVDNLPYDDSAVPEGGVRRARPARCSTAPAPTPTPSSPS